jgi:hypothetical protein
MYYEEFPSLSNTETQFENGISFLRAQTSRKRPRDVLSDLTKLAHNKIIFAKTTHQSILSHVVSIILNQSTIAAF